MKKVKVLHLITDLGKGGAERFLVDICNQMINDERFEICIGSLFDNHQYPDLDPRIPVVLLDYPLFSIRKKNECSKYKELLESFKPDIIHTHRFLGEFLSSYYLDNKIRYVTHGHDNMVQFSPVSLNTLKSKESLLHLIEFNWLKRKKYNKVDTWFIANSEHTFEYYKRVLPSNQKSNVKLIQYGFNFEKFYDQSNHRDISNKTKFKFVNVGSYQKKKNQRFFIDVALEFKKRNFPFEINLIGDGELRSSVANEIKENNLENEVKVLGIQHNVDEWYKNSDIYLHAATYEPFGLVFLEAMASGLPVISLDGKGNRDIIENGKNGWIIDEPNAVEFVTRVIDCLQNKDSYKTISDQVIQYAKQFDLRTKNEELFSFYKSIL